MASKLQRREELAQQKPPLETDVAERLQPEGVLRVSEELYRRIVETTNEALWIIDAEARLTFANGQAAKMLGYCLHEILGKPLSVFMGEEAQATIKTKEALRHQGIADQYEFKLRRKDGTELWVLTSATPIFDDKGVYSGTLGMATDVTERKRAERNLEHRLAVETAVAQVSGLLAARGDVDLTSILGVLGRVLGASRVYIARLRDNGKKADNTHEWCAPGVSPRIHALRNVDVSTFPWWFANLLHSEAVVVPHIAELPQEALAEYQQLPVHDNKSLVAVPMVSAGEVIGILGFQDTHGAREWPEEDVRLLRTASESLVAYMERQQAKERLRMSEERYRTLAEAAQDAIFVIGRAGYVEYVNTFGAKLVGLQPEDLLAKRPEELVPPEIPGLWQVSLEKAVETGEPAYTEQKVQFPGREMWLGTRLVPMRDKSGRMTAVLGISRDITERKRLEAELARRYREAKYLAEHDPVTGLLNHRAIHKRLDQEVRRARRSGRQLAIIVMDLDEFKLFNDAYGHPVGDKVLQQLAALLKENVREPGLVGRCGGDEFTVILRDTDTDGAIALADRLRAALAHNPYRTPDGLAVPLHMSFGIATYPTDACQPHELIGCADANLYESKQRGGDIVTTNEDPGPAGDAKLGSFGVLDGLVTAVDRKDHYTRKHSEDVTGYAIAIAQALGLSVESQRTLRTAGLLHDVGKIGIPDRILHKPGRLDDEESAIIKQHVTLGELIVKDLPNLADVVAAIGAHHERVDGQGYPRGLKGEEIPLLGRILAVADAYSAMTTDRPYRMALNPEQARTELLQVAGMQLDYNLVSIFLRVLDDKAGSRAEEMLADVG